MRQKSHGGVTHIVTRYQTKDSSTHHVKCVFKVKDRVFWVLWVLWVLSIQFIGVHSDLIYLRNSSTYRTVCGTSKVSLRQGTTNAWNFGAVRFSD